jgi:GxxExxY protein
LAEAVVMDRSSPFRTVEPPVEVDADARGVIGAAIEVHRFLGPGFLEAVYEEALAVEFAMRHIKFSRQVEVPIFYKDHELTCHRLDFVINDRLVIEIKAVAALLPLHTSQVISYLRATNLQLGLLLNFNVPMLKEGTKRVIWNG